MRRRSHIPSAAKNTSEFNAGHSNPVRHRRVGVWDYFEQKRPSARGFPGLWQWAADIRHTLPYVWQMVKDLASLEHCRTLFMVYFLLEWLSSMIPALQLANQGKMLDMVRREFTSLLILMGSSRSRTLWINAQLTLISWPASPLLALDTQSLADWWDTTSSSHQTFSAPTYAASIRPTSSMPCPGSMFRLSMIRL